ncbi:MAG: hypothetical protein WCK90_06125 [archaeon]
MTLSQVKRRMATIVLALVLIVVFAYVALKFYHGEIKFEERSSTPLNESDFCLSDADCMPSPCCHPTSCVPKYRAHDCRGVFCSDVCEAGTLDCGQGSCLCVNNACKTIINSKTPTKRVQ